MCRKLTRSVGAESFQTVQAGIRKAFSGIPTSKPIELKVGLPPLRLLSEGKDFACRIEMSWQALQQHRERPHADGPCPGSGLLPQVCRMAFNAWLVRLIIGLSPALSLSPSLPGKTLFSATDACCGRMHLPRLRTAGFATLAFDCVYPTNFLTFLLPSFHIRVCMFTNTTVDRRRWRSVLPF